MTAPCEPEAASEPHEEEPEIVLRLSDILPRVPPHLLKPGPHDTMARIRFSVDELAEKIARGRVSVPLERLASVCPDVFLDSGAVPAEQEIPLPLQKLLEQVGLVAPKPHAPNGMPREQLAQARAEAGRILEAKTASSPVQTPPAQSSPGPSSPDPSSPSPAVEPPASAPAPSAGLGKVFSSLFGRRKASTESPEASSREKPVVLNPPSAEQLSGSEAARQPLPEPADLPVPPGHISLRVLPIFRLLPAQLLKSAELPPEAKRIVLPLSMIDPQLVSGHVEMPVEEFIKALPRDLSGTINPVPDTQVWIPLDEIFQNLPPDHLFYMPPLSPVAEDAPVSPGEEPPPANEAPAVAKESAPAEAPPATIEPPAVEAIPALKEEPPASAEHTPLSDPVLEAGKEAEAETVAAESISKDIPAKGEAPHAADPPPPPPAAPEEPASEAVAPVPPPEDAATPPLTETNPAAPGESPSPQPAGDAPQAAQDPAPEAVAPPSPGEPAPPASAGGIISPLQEESAAAAAPAASAETTSPPAAAAPADPGAKSGAAAPAPPPDAKPQEPARPTAEQGPASPPPSRAPWMHGFQVPPPRLFSSSTIPAEPSPEAAESEQPPPPAATPEAKQTADFLASQPGIFASAAFVQGAVFASEDFPRRPDLDALREFMGVFIESARESGRRLGWNRVLTMACEQFHLTAVVRDTHFIVALHHDRVLASVTYDALIAAADDLSKAAG